MKKVLERIKEDVLILDHKGTIQYCNEKLGLKLQCSGALIKGWKIDQLIQEEEAIEHFWESLIEGKEIFTSFRVREGQQLRCQFRVIEEVFEHIPVYLLLGKVQEVQNSHVPQMKLILDQLPIGIMVKGLNNKYTYVNQMAHKLYEKNLGEVVGEDDSKFCSEEEALIIDEEDQAVLNTQTPNQAKVWFHLKETKLIDLCKFPFYKNGQLAGLIKVGEDETLKWLFEYKQGEGYKELMRIDEEGSKRERIKRKDFQEISIESCLIRKLEADGVNVLAYDAEKGLLVSKFYDGICREIIQEEGLSSVPAMYTKKALENERRAGVYPIEKSILEEDKAIFLSRGVKDIGLYPIYYGEDFMGILLTLYKEYDYNQMGDREFAERICSKLSVILKQLEIGSKLRRELERRKKVEEELEHLLETTADVMKILDKQGNILKVSQSFCNILGIHKQEVIGQSYTMFIHPEEQMHTYIEQAEKETVVENHYINKEGKSTCIEWRTKYIAEKEIYICTGTDVTSMRLLESQREEYERKIQQDVIKNEFFIKISHEFRTPLNIILSALQLLHEMKQGMQQEKLLEEMGEKTYRLLGLANNLIDITEIDTGFSNLNLAEHDIVEVIESATEKARGYTQQRQIDIIFDTEIEEQLISCDRLKIERVMGILIGDAIKRIADEGMIKVEVAFDTGEVRIAIKDNGKLGSVEELRNRFERCEKGNIDNIELFIAKAFIRIHDGNIFIQNTREEGMVVCFKLPTKIGDNVDTYTRKY